MIVHLVDGTYELFRHFYGLRRFTSGTLASVCGASRRAKPAARAAERPEKAGTIPRRLEKDGDMGNPGSYERTRTNQRVYYQPT